MVVGCAGAPTGDAPAPETATAASSLGVARSTIERTFVVTGTVRALARGPTSLFVGTSTSLGATGVRTGPWVVLDESTFAEDKSFAELGGGTVNAQVGDGAGGYYVAGSFRRAGSVAATRIVHVRADGSVDSTFAPPAPNGLIRGLARASGRVYLTGTFTALGASSRLYVAAVDETTGALATLPSSLPTPGFALAATDAAVFAGRTSALDVIDAATGALIRTLPASGTIRALARSGTTIYLGGDISSIDGVPRGSAAALDASTLAVLPFDPQTIAQIHAIAVADDEVYLGGQLGNPPAVVYAVDPVRGVLSPRTLPVTGGMVYALAVDGDALVVGGDFTTPGGKNLVTVERSTFAVRAANRRVSDVVRSLLASGGRVAVGGDFAAVHVYPRGGVVEIDLATRTATAFDVRLENGAVQALAVVGGTLYVGGSFISRAAGGRCHSLLAFDVATGAELPFHPTEQPGCGYSVAALATDGATLYVGGNFNELAGEPRYDLGAFDVATGALLPFAPNPRNNKTMVSALLLDGPVLYAGGVFTSCGGAPRTAVCAIATATGAALPFDAHASTNANVLALARRGGALYVGGKLTSLGCATRTNLGAVDATTGAALPFAPVVDDWVRAFAVAGDRLHVGGDFRAVGGSARYGLASLDADTGALVSGPRDAFPASGTYDVTALEASGDALHVGGVFRSVVSGSLRVDQQGVARFSGP